MESEETTIELHVSPTSQKGEFEYRLLLKDEKIGYVRMHSRTSMVLVMGSDVWRLVDELKMTGEELITNGCHHSVYSIEYIHVAEAARRQGHAKRLLDKVILEHGDKEMYLYVEPIEIQYSVLVALYEKYGFMVFIEWAHEGGGKKGYMYRQATPLATSK